MGKTADRSKQSRWRLTERRNKVLSAAGLLVASAVGFQFDRLVLGIAVGVVFCIAMFAFPRRGEGELAALKEADLKRLEALNRRLSPGPDSNLLEALKAYTDGKMHRYNLLFAVNGGAFLVAKSLLEKPGKEALLPIEYVAQGAIIYTLLMGLDIFLYGEMMRKTFVGDIAFTPAGKALLVFMVALLVIGWAVVFARASRVAGCG